jgi:hypothetical protein
MLTVRRSVDPFGRLEPLEPLEPSTGSGCCGLDSRSGLHADRIVLR